MGSDLLFIIGDWNTKVGSQEIPRVVGKFGIGVRNEAGQSKKKFHQKNTRHSKHPFPTMKRWLYTWISPNGQYQNQTDYILCSKRWKLYTVSKNKTWS